MSISLSMPCRSAFTATAVLASSLLLSGLLDGLCAQTDAEIQFSVEGLNEGDTIFLANYYGNRMYYADTAVVDSKGKFAFTSPAPDKGGKLSLIHI